MKFRLYNYLLTSFHVILFSTNLYAQEEDSLTIYYHEDIVVTATRTEKKAFDVSRSLTIISRDAIKNNVHISPADLLSRSEGMSFIGNGQTPGSAQNVFMRGVNANSTAVMIDGVRLTDPSSIENGFNFAELSLMNMNHIEVIRGAHSTLYGSSAVGGVINFISEKNRKPGFNADVYMQTGTFGGRSAMFDQNLFLNYTFENGFYMNGEIFNSSVDGINATVDIVPDSVKFKNPDKDNFSRLEFSLKSGFINNNWDTFISYRHSEQKADIDSGVFADDDNAFLKNKRNLFIYKTIYNFSQDLNISLSGGFSDIKRISVDDSSIADKMGNYDHKYSNGVYEGTTWNTEILSNYNLENVSVLLGGGMEKETMSSENYIYSNSMWGLYESKTSLDTLNLNTTTYNMFLHFDLNGGLVDRQFELFALALGGRWNNHSEFGNTFTYEINPSCKINSTLIYGSLATGFNAPSLYRLFTPDVHFSSGITRGNPNLKPEKSTTMEIGLRHSFNKNHSFFAALFNNKISNIHEYVYLWDGTTAFDSLSYLDDRGDTYINAGIIDITGLEAGFSSLLMGQFLLTGNFSWLQGKQNYSANDADTRHTQGNYIQIYNNGSFLSGNYNVNGLARRSNTANFTLSYFPNNDLTIGSQIRYVGKRDDIFYNTSLGPYGSLDRVAVKAYLLLDINARYRIIEQTQLTLRIENVTDKKYSEIKGYNTRGRGFYLGLRYSF